mgnify:CR=1 FL=1
MKAEIILTGGRVFKGLAEGFAEAVAIGGGRILAAASAAEVEALRGPDTRVIALEGRAVVPGFNDAHLHLLNLGRAMAELNLRTESGVDSVAEILARVAEAARGAKPGTWIKGRGYDHDQLAERRHPSIEELDRAAPDNPVYLERTCSHLAVVNSAALALAGVDAGTPDPQGGRIERRHGAFTGLLAERAMRLVGAVLPPPTEADLVEAIERAGTALLAQGITSVMDAAIGMHAGYADAEAFEAAAARGRLPLRVWACLYGDPGGVVEAAHAAGLRFGRRQGLLRYGAAKIFTDGSAGGLTAAIGEPYLVGLADNRGILCFSDAEAHDLLRRYHALGYQLAIHAIGDRAIEQVLSGMEAIAAADGPIATRRPRIEHCGFLSPAQRRRMAAAGVLPVPQPAFVYEFGDLYLTNLGRDRSEAAYPMRNWVDEGHRPSASSDAPVCSTDPFKNIYTMVTRRTQAGTEIGGRQRLTVAEAVHAYTHNGAWSQFAEAETGLIATGMRADVAVLSHNLFDIAPDVIRDEVRCDLTILDGRIAHERDGPQ